MRIVLKKKFLGKATLERTISISLSFGGSSRDFSIIDKFPKKIPNTINNDPIS